jgi:hypothetical protein
MAEAIKENLNQDFIKLLDKLEQEALDNDFLITVSKLKFIKKDIDLIQQSAKLKEPNEVKRIIKKALNRVNSLDGLGLKTKDLTTAINDLYKDTYSNNLEVLKEGPTRLSLIISGLKEDLISKNEFDFLMKNLSDDIDIAISKQNPGTLNHTNLIALKENTNKQSQEYLKTINPFENARSEIKSESKEEKIYKAESFDSFEDTLKEASAEKNSPFKGAKATIKTQSDIKIKPEEKSAKQSITLNRSDILESDPLFSEKASLKASLSSEEKELSSSLLKELEGIKKEAMMLNDAVTLIQINENIKDVNTFFAEPNKRSNFDKLKKIKVQVQKNLIHLNEKDRSYRTGNAQALLEQSYNNYYTKERIFLIEGQTKIQKLKNDFENTSISFKNAVLMKIDIKAEISNLKRIYNTPEMLETLGHSILKDLENNFKSLNISRLNYNKFIEQKEIKAQALQDKIIAKQPSSGPNPFKDSKAYIETSITTKNEYELKIEKKVVESIESLRMLESTKISQEALDLLKSVEEKTIALNNVADKKNNFDKVDKLYNEINKDFTNLIKFDLNEEYLITAEMEVTSLHSHHYNKTSQVLKDGPDKINELLNNLKESDADMNNSSYNKAYNTFTINSVFLKSQIDSALDYTKANTPEYKKLQELKKLAKEHLSIDKIFPDRSIKPNPTFLSNEQIDSLKIEQNKISLSKKEVLSKAFLILDKIEKEQKLGPISNKKNIAKIQEVIKMLQQAKQIRKQKNRFNLIARFSKSKSEQIIENKLKGITETIKRTPKSAQRKLI